MKELKELPFDRAELDIFLQMLDERPDRKIRGQIYSRIRTMTNWSWHRLHENTGRRHSVITIRSSVKLSQEAPVSPLQPLQKIVPMASSPSEHKVSDHIYDATAAMARVQQLSSMEVAAALSESMDRDRFKLALRHLIEHAEILLSLADHCERSAQAREAVLMTYPLPTAQAGGR